MSAGTSCSYETAVDGNGNPTTFTVTLQGWLPNQSYDFILNEAIYDTFQTDSSGNATYTYQIPTNQQSMFLVTAADGSVTGLSGSMWSATPNTAMDKSNLLHWHRAIS